jgi:hypothetical protein
MIRQVSTSTVTFKSVMKTALFNLGVKEAREGKPFNYDAGITLNDQWAYERGRIFGTRFKQGSVKDNRGAVTGAAINAMRLAIQEKVIL